MGITQFVDEFYIDLPRETFRRSPTVGQLCWVPSVHIDPIPRILEVERADPQEHHATRFEIRDMIKDDFKQKQRLPIKSLSLYSTEELIVQKAKKRPAIVVSAEHTIFDDVAQVLKRLGRRHLQQENILVVPLYGVETEEHERGFPPIMAAKIRALMYKQFFYCLRNNDPLAVDSVARLDRIQVIVPRHPTYTPTPVALGPESLSILLGQLRFLFGGEEEEFLTVRDIAMEALPEEAQ